MALEMSVRTRLTAGELTLDEGSREAFLGGAPLKLTRLEFDLLAYLLRHRDRAVPRQELLDEIWGPGYSPESNVVDVVVASLRRKLADDPRRPRYIITVPAVGYRMSAEETVPGRQRRLVYLGMAMVGGGLAAGLVAGLLAAFGVFGLGGGDSGTAVAENGGGVEISFVAETRTTRSPTVAGDCRREDLTIDGWQSAGTVSGDLSGTVEMDCSGRLFYTAGCLVGAAKGTMVLVDESGERLETVVDRIFFVVQLEPPPAPSATESLDIVTVVGGTGRFANASGSGTCETTALLEYETARSSLESASRSDCRLTLKDGVTLPSRAALSVRLVANPTRVGLVGTQDPSKPAATYAMALYRNEGQRDLSDLTLTLLPAEGVTMKATSRMGDGEADPPVRTWQLPDLRAGERHVFDFSVQFESTDRREVPLVVRLSSPDMDEPVESAPIVIEVE